MGRLSDEEYEARILANVREFGCHVTTVVDPEGAEESFSYSTGFTRSLGQGEVIVFGLPAKLMGFMVNDTYQQCQAGLRLSDGVRISGLLDGFDVVARSVLQANIQRKHFNSAMWFHRREFDRELDTAYQLVWPGAQNGLFPWEDGAAAEVGIAQPPLYEPGALH